MPVLRIDPVQRPRLADIRDNLTARIVEAEREGWLGEAEGPRVSLAAARDRLAQLDDRTRRAATVSLGIPAYRDIAARTPPAPKPPMMPPGSILLSAGGSGCGDRGGGAKYLLLQLVEDADWRPWTMTAFCFPSVSWPGARGCRCARSGSGPMPACCPRRSVPRAAGGCMTRRAWPGWI
jgi:hypothetical protein